MGSSPGRSGTPCQSADSVALDEENIWNQCFDGSFWPFSKGSWARHEAALLLLPILNYTRRVKEIPVEKASCRRVAGSFCDTRGHASWLCEGFSVDGSEGGLWWAADHCLWEWNCGIEVSRFVVMRRYNQAPDGRKPSNIRTIPIAMTGGEKTVWW